MALLICTPGSKNPLLGDRGPHVPFVSLALPFGCEDNVHQPVISAGLPDP